MTPEERKAIAMRQGPSGSRCSVVMTISYPRCCSYHQGFDAALAQLVDLGYLDGEGYHDASVRHFTIDEHA